MSALGHKVQISSAIGLQFFGKKRVVKNGGVLCAVTISTLGNKHSEVSWSGVALPSTIRVNV